MTKRRREAVANARESSLWQRGTGGMWGQALTHA